MSFADFRKRWDCTVQTLQYAVIEGVIQDVGNGNTCIVQTGTGTVTVELVQCSRRRFRKGFNRFNKGDRVKCDGVNKDSQFVAREIQCLN
jgi:DNA/RNA endonuclease YhcR with UshA esterase domain